MYSKGTEIRAVRLLPPAVAGVAFSTIVWRMTTAGDFPSHIEAAAGLFRGGPVPPHFGYHALVALLHEAIPMVSWRAAAAAITLAGVIVLAAVLGREVAAALDAVRVDIRWFLAATLPIAALLVQPLLPWPQVSRDQWLTGYFPASQWHNPTTLLVKATALPLFNLGVSGLRGVPATGALLAGAATLSVASLLIKPNLLMALLPALGVLALLRPRRAQWALLAALALPAVVVLGGQYLYYFNRPGEGVTVMFAPFHVIGLTTPVDAQTLTRKLLASILFPLAVTVCFPAALKDDRMRLAWGAFVAGAAQGYLLAEGGGQAEDGNFMWSATIATWVLFAVSLLFLLGQLARRTDRARPTAIAGGAVCLVILAAHVVSGARHLQVSWFG